MKKISRRVLIVTLAALILGLLTACAGANSIEKITVGAQESNGVSVKNYNVFLKDSVDWPALSDKDREKIAVAAFDEAQKKIAEEGTHNYNISGITGDTVAFQYDGENKVMIIWLDNKPAATVAVTLPAE
jgi:hypothetical protein